MIFESHFLLNIFCGRNSHKQVPYDIQEFGNLGGASIPTLMTYSAEEL